MKHNEGGVFTFEVNLKNCTKRCKLMKRASQFFFFFFFRVKRCESGNKSGFIGCIWVSWAVQAKLSSLDSKWKKQNNRISPWRIQCNSILLVHQTLETGETEKQHLEKKKKKSTALIVSRSERRVLFPLQSSVSLPLLLLVDLKYMSHLRQSSDHGAVSTNTLAAWSDFLGDL